MSEKEGPEILDGGFVSKPYGENLTRRLTVSAAEAILYKPFKVLDSGFVRLVDYMGGDSSIPQAARVSYGQGTKKVSEDESLIRYLLRHRHTTPSEMLELKFHAKMPIFVARQWVRHRTASINEMSGRYSVMPAEFYTPEPEVMAEQSKSNRQGREKTLSVEEAERIRKMLIDDAERDFAHYGYYLNEDPEHPGTPLDSSRDMLARELARIGLPLSMYTQWYWKVDMHNLLHFLSLRKDKHAQWEMRQYADKMGEIARAVAPIEYKAFEDYVLNAISLSALEIRVMGRIMSGENPEAVAEEIIPNKIERREFFEKLERLKEQS